MISAMSKLNPTFRYPLHWLVIYNFRYTSYIPIIYTTNVFNSHRKQKTGLKWASQLITQIWKLIYGQWTHCSKLKYRGEALDNHLKELILNAKITDEQKRGHDTLPCRYNPYFITPLSTILDTSIISGKIGTSSSIMLEKEH